MIYVTFECDVCGAKVELKLLNSERIYTPYGWLDRDDLFSTGYNTICQKCFNIVRDNIIKVINETSNNK